MDSEPTRRDFIKTAGTAGIAGLAGCNTTDDSEETPTDTTAEETPTAQDPTYDIRVSALEYDLTDLATSETNQHDQAYVEDNYSAELGVTVLNNGEEAGLEELGEVHLEDEEGERVQTTEDGYVPEYAVEDGQELTVRAEIDGETVEETITVTKELPGEFYADATIREDGEVIYETDWDTPYSFDNHIVDRQAFLNQRAERRDELADDEIILESDLETWRDHFEDEEDELTEEEKKEYYLGAMSGIMEGASIYEGTGVDDNAFNLEKAMLEHSPYEEVFVGGFVNPEEPDVPSAGDGDGFEVESKLAFVDGDWYQGTENFGFQHISEVNENPMAEANSGINAVSVLAEFERGNTDIESPEHAEEYVEEAVTSPVTLNGHLGGERFESRGGWRSGIELSDDISWAALNSVKENQGWGETMVPIELATAIAQSNDEFTGIYVEGGPEDARFKVSDDDIVY